MNYLNMLIGGTSIILGADYFIRRYYKKENSKILNKILNYVEDYIMYSEKECPTCKKNKLEKEVKD